LPLIDWLSSIVTDTVISVHIMSKISDHPHRQSLSSTMMVSSIERM